LDSLLQVEKRFSGCTTVARTSSTIDREQHPAFVDGLIDGWMCVIFLVGKGRALSTKLRSNSSKGCLVANILSFDTSRSSVLVGGRCSQASGISRSSLLGPLHNRAGRGHYAVHVVRPPARGSSPSWLVAGREIGVPGDADVALLCPRDHGSPMCTEDGSPIVDGASGWRSATRRTGAAR
jgi:hypothetical protein